MDGTALYSFTQQLLGNIQMDTTLFNSLLNTAQMNRENAREWMILKKKDSSQTANAADTFLTSKNLPSDFLKFVSKNPVQLVDSPTNPTTVLYYTQVPFESQMGYQYDATAFYVDYNNNLLYLAGGPLSKSFTILQFYIFKPANIIYSKTTGASTSWIFPAWTHPILSFDVAAMFRLGVDYDDLNKRMGDENAQMAEVIMNSMIKWDSKLQKDSVKDMDIIQAGGSPYQKGRIPIYGN